MQASQPEQRLRRTGGHCGGGLRHPCAFAPCTPADGILAGPWAVTHIQGSAGFSQEGQPPDRVAVLVSIVCLKCLTNAALADARYANSVFVDRLVLWLMEGENGKA